MFKDYLEDKQESKIIFDDSSIDTIEKILSNHDKFYIEFPKYEIKIKSSSLNKIFSLSKISKEENILFSFRTPENELTKSYPDLLESINLNKSNEKKNENKKKPIVKRPVNKRPGSMKFPPNLRNELKKNLKKDNNIYPIKENEAQSDDEGEMRMKLKVMMKEKEVKLFLKFLLLFFLLIKELILVFLYLLNFMVVLEKIMILLLKFGFFSIFL